jgi:integrase
VLGLRWSEVIGLRIGDVDYLTRTLHVRQAVEEVNGRVRIVPATKSDASRRSLAVPPTVTEALARHVATFRPGAAPDASG